MNNSNISFAPSLAVIEVEIYDPNRVDSTIASVEATPCTIPWGAAPSRRASVAEEFSIPHCVVNFTEKRRDRNYVINLISQNRPYKLTSPILDMRLRDGEYCPVLLALMRELDHPTRLEWLRNRSNQLHAPLMFEEALQSFIASPTIETIISVAMPALAAGKFRAEQDCQCLKVHPPNGENLPDRLHHLYLAQLNQRVEALLQRSLRSIYDEHKDEITALCKKKVLETAQASLECHLPPPHWVKYYGNTNQPPNISLKKSSLRDVRMQIDYARSVIIANEREQNGDGNSNKRAKT